MRLGTFLRCAAAIAVLCSYPAAVRAAPASVDEEAAVALAVERDASAAGARIDAAAAERRRENAGGFLLPSLVASVSGTEALSSAADPAASGTAKLSSTLNLSASGFKSKETAAREASVFALERRAAEDRVGAKARKAFYRLILLAEQVKLAESAVEAARDGAERTEAEYRSGLSSALVRRQAAVSLEIERLALERKRNEREVAAADFKSLIGVEAGTELYLAGSLDTPMLDLDRSPAPDLSRRTDVGLIAAKRSAQESRIAEDRLDRGVPSLALTGSVTASISDLFGGASSASLSDRTVTGGSVTVTLSSPNLSAFLPFSEEAEDSAALRDVSDKLRSQQDEIERAAGRETVTLLSGLAVSRLAIASLTASLSLAEEVVVLTREAYAVGAASYQDLRDAEKGLDTARVDLLAERYTYLATIIDLEYSVGRRLRAAKE